MMSLGLGILQLLGTVDLILKKGCPFGNDSLQEMV